MYSNLDDTGHREREQSFFYCLLLVFPSLSVSPLSLLSPGQAVLLHAFWPCRGERERRERERREREERERERERERGEREE